MKKLLILVVIALSVIGVFAQNVGMGTNTPHASAKLDIQASNMGILIPQVDLDTVNFPAPGPATGLLVWNSNAAYGNGIGFYYNFGTTGAPSWLKVADAGSINDADADPTNENQTVSAGTGIGVSVSGQDYTVTNTAPDQTVGLTGGGATSVSGTYPNFTVTSTDNVNDADADPTNEIQNLTNSVSGTNRTINISGGTGTTFSVADNDNDSSNEYNTDVTLTGTTLNVIDGGGTESVNLDALQDHNWYEVGQTRGADNINDNIFTQGTAVIGATTVEPNMTLDVVGNLFARKYVVQNGTDGGTSRGIFMWQENDTNWGIYMGQSGAARSLSGGTATAGGGFTQHAIRFRVANSGTQGFIFENGAETNLFSIKGNNGRATFFGPVVYDCNTCGDASNIDGVSDYGDMVIQGRVLSTSSNLHLSPPSGFNVIINDTYRSAGGVSTGTAGLQVESLAGIGNRNVYTDASGVVQAGDCIDIQFHEGFPNANFPSDWTRTNTTDVEIVTCANTGTHSLLVEGDAEATSPVLNLGNCNDAVYISYAFREANGSGCGEEADLTDFLIVEYRLNGGAWVQIASYEGSLNIKKWTSELFEINSGTNANIQVRFRSDGTGAGFDSWLVDNVCVSNKPGGVPGNSTTSGSMAYLESRAEVTHDNVNGGFRAVGGTTNNLSVKAGDIISISVTLKYAFTGGSGNDDIRFRIGIVGCQNTSSTDTYEFENFDNDRNEYQSVALQYIHVANCDGNLNFQLFADNNSDADDNSKYGDLIIVATRH